MSGGLWIGLLILLGVLWLDTVAPVRLLEGFQAASSVFGGVGAAPPVPAEPTNILTSGFLKRGDVGYYLEVAGYKADKRYFQDYADVQRIGQKNDFCRMVFPEGGKEDQSFFACALAGTPGLSAVAYRTKSVADGFRRSRDDYMRAIQGDKRDAYCRILKELDGTFQPMCVTGDDSRFGARDVLDPAPPEDIKTMVDFYRGVQLWFRFRDDMLDYALNATAQTAGGLQVPEDPPKPTVTRGLLMNGVDQFLRIGDTSDLRLGTKGALRGVRAWSMWVKFDAFTNNAHIFDFGDGPGRNNVFLGILGKGDAAGANGGAVRPGPKCQETTVPDGKSGAQFCREMTPQDLMTLSSANIDEFSCTGFETGPDAKRSRPLETRPTEQDTGETPTRATLLYEVWDSRLRKVQIKLNGVVPLKKWVHIVITATSMDAVRPNLNVYINGNFWYQQEAGFLPQADETTNNYFGKSNWADVGDQYELRDELMAGSIFDFRMYRNVLSEEKVKRIVAWGAPMLGLSTVGEETVGA